MRFYEVRPWNLGMPPDLEMKMRPVFAKVDEDVHQELLAKFGELFSQAHETLSPAEYRKLIDHCEVRTDSQFIAELFARDPSLVPHDLGFEDLLTHLDNDDLAQLAQSIEVPLSELEVKREAGRARKSQ